jgi:predicted phosphodiesterase
MSKRILVVPDVHGETFWREHVQKYLEQVDRIIFLGDYLDPYRDKFEEYDAESVFNNMMEIVNLKLENKEKVILLKGNHDYHYSSKRALLLACASRCDIKNWHRYNKVFNDYEDFFNLAHLEEANGITYIFSHAGLTTYWINKVNAKIWKLNDRDISIADQSIIDKINMMEYDLEGQNMLAIIGKSRSIKGEKSGSLLWADIYEHSIPDAPKAYGLNQVYQFFGHTRLEEDIVAFDNLALIDSRQCFMIDENLNERIVTIKKYEDSLAK